MAYLIGILITIIILLLGYIGVIEMQIRSMSEQLERRLKAHTRQNISVQLVSKNLNRLVICINKCLKAEENLRLKSMQEEKQFKEMIANISHDLRTPLTAIQGYQQLLEKGELSEEQRKRLAVARKHSEELKGLIDHFFEYAYLLNTQPEIKLKRINLTGLVTDCLIASITSFEEANKPLEFEETAPVYVEADEEMVTRIVQNLIRNSVEHSEGTIKVEVLSNKEGILRFINPVREPEKIDIQRLFERFYSGDEARSRMGGLGLSIVKLLAEQMKGNVTAEIKGDLLEIKVTLPLAQ